MKKILSSILIISSFTSFAQTKTVMSTPTGVRIQQIGGAAINGTTARTVFWQDTIKAYSLVAGKEYQLRMMLNLTTPVINIATVTIRVKLGSDSITITNASLAVGSLSNAPLIADISILANNSNSQILSAMIRQAYPTINLSTSNTNLRGTFAQDSSVDIPISVVILLGGVSIGSNVLSTDAIKREDF